MMPKSDLFGAIPPAHGRTQNTVSLPLPAVMPGTGEEFSALVSQALSKSPNRLNRADSPDPQDQAKLPQAPGASPFPAPENSDTDYAESMNAAAGKSQATTTHVRKAKGQPVASADVSSTGPGMGGLIDASILGAVMASLAQPEAIRHTVIGQNDNPARDDRSSTELQAAGLAPAPPRSNDTNFASDAVLGTNEEELASASPLDLDKVEPPRDKHSEGNDLNVASEAESSAIASLAGSRAGLGPRKMPAIGTLKEAAGTAAEKNEMSDAHATALPGNSLGNGAPVPKGIDAAVLNESSFHSISEHLPASARTPGSEASHPVSRQPSKTNTPALAGTGKPLPSNDSPLGNESSLVDSEKSLQENPQLALSQDVSLALPPSPDQAVSIDGTGAALGKQRMKPSGEKNEIAGRAVQKLPNAPAVGASPASVNDKANGANGKGDADLSKQTRESMFPGSLAYFTGQSTSASGFQGKLSEMTPSTDAAAVQVERVANLVSQEVFMLRQSGANSLAVSLKVDSNTELFLQLTNHDGQIQASLRCDRGNVEGLGTHWGELQESLARQNVQLMPFEDRTSSRGALAIDPPSASDSSRAFDPSSQNRQQQFRDSQDEPTVAPAAGTGRPLQKTRTTNRSRLGWETWA